MAYKTKGSRDSGTTVKVFNDVGGVSVDGLGTLKSGKYTLKLIRRTASGSLFYTIPAYGAYMEQLPDSFNASDGDVFVALIDLPPEGHIVRKSKKGQYALALAGDKETLVSDWEDDISALLRKHLDKALAMPVLISLSRDGTIVYERYAK